jgi:hypothetical protein
MNIKLNSENVDCDFVTDWQLDASQVSAPQRSHRIYPGADAIACSTEYVPTIIRSTPINSTNPGVVENASK